MPRSSPSKATATASKTATSPAPPPPPSDARPVKWPTFRPALPAHISTGLDTCTQHEPNLHAKRRSRTPTVSLRHSPSGVGERCLLTGAVPRPPGRANPSGVLDVAGACRRSGGACADAPSLQWPGSSRVATFNPRVPRAGRGDREDELPELIVAEGGAGALPYRVRNVVSTTKVIAAHWSRAARSRSL